jgi:hypothetical protein
MVTCCFYPSAMPIAVGVCSKSTLHGCTTSRYRHFCTHYFVDGRFLKPYGAVTQRDYVTTFDDAFPGRFGFAAQIFSAHHT